jgi:hypothetical protein
MLHLSGTMWIYAGTIFLSAFLLFQIQPMAAKWLLPVFGGSASVWTTCMLFFQSALLLGYLYSERSVRRLTPRVQVVLHAVLLALSALVLMVRPGVVRDWTGGRHPIIGITVMLVVSVGIPYFLLSTTTPLLQAWYARGRKTVLPYRLFALSNLASILALLGYPVLVEPYLSLRRQFQVWSWAYSLFAAMCLISAFRSLNAGAASQAADESFEPSPRPGWDAKLMWMALAACASILLLAVTNHLTQNVAPVPLLWVIPFCVYLLSFVICFESDDWPRLPYWRWLVAPTLVGLSLLLLKGRIGGLVFTVAVFAASLFLCCMFCHGELARLKPHSRFLTSFYLMVSIGGAFGGIFVGLIAPMVFTGYFELPVGMAFCAILALHLSREERSVRQLARLLVVAFGAFLVCVKLFTMVSGTRVMARNFYGSVRVRDEFPKSGAAFRVLYHGSIVHGVQFLAPQRRLEPTCYYGNQSGVALAIERSRRPGMRVGVIGLGAGTVSTFGRPGDYFRFYEINDMVIRIANTEFTFLRESRGKVDVVEGDGRLALDHEPGQNFDLLVLDAFSGDSIPVHLLTKEAFSIYFRHLNPSGMLAANVSNSYLDIKSIVERLSAYFGKQAVVIRSGGSTEDRTLEAMWVLVANGSGLYDNPRIKSAGEATATRTVGDVWTDDYSNLLRALR